MFLVREAQKVPDDKENFPPSVCFPGLPCCVYFKALRSSEVRLWLHDPAKPSCYGWLWSYSNDHLLRTRLLLSQPDQRGFILYQIKLQTQLKPNLYNVCKQQLKLQKYYLDQWLHPDYRPVYVTLHNFARCTNVMNYNNKNLNPLFQDDCHLIARNTVQLYPRPRVGDPLPLCKKSLC